MRPEDFVSPRVQAVPPSGIRRFFDLIAQTKGVISLGVGEPDFVTPWHIREACFYSLEKGYTMYTSNAGLPELREEIAAYMARRYRVNYNPANEILVTVGASEAIDLALRAVIESDDEVLVPEPSFVAYKPGAIFAGGKAVVVETRASNLFRLTATDLQRKITPRSKVLILNYPNNPTGAVMTRSDLEAVAQVARQHNLLVISDEIYSELTYEGEHTCLAALPGMWERTIVLNGFSKAFAMTGWRVGYALGPAPIIEAMHKIHQYGIMCASTMGQKAAVEALRNGEEEMRKMVRQYDRRRRIIVNGFNKMGLSCFEPQGAFYAFPSISTTGMTSEDFSEKLLQEEKVAVVPGIAFGDCGEGYIRCSYASSIENINEALRRIELFINRHGLVTQEQVEVGN